MVEPTTDRLSGPGGDPNPLPRFRAETAAGLLAAALGEDADEEAYGPFAEAYVQCADTMPARLAAGGCDGLEAAAAVAFTYFRDTVATQDDDARAATLQLLTAAYVVNRTDEGINDIAERFVGVPLTSTALMIANVLVHGALGDGTSNTLEQLAVGGVDDAAVTRSLVRARFGQDHLNRLAADGRALDGDPVGCLAQKYGLRLPGSPY